MIFPQCYQDICILYVELWWRVTVLFQLFFCQCNSYSKPLDVSKVFHCLCKMGIAVICDSWLPKILYVDLPIWTSGIRDFDTVRKPVYSYWCICSFVCA